MSTSAPGLTIDRSQSLSDGFGRRLSLSGLALVYVLLAVPALFLLVVMTVSLSVSVIGIGALLLLVWVPLNRQLANLHRELSGHILGVEIERPYKRNEPTGSAFALLKSWATDSARWRDYAWTWMSVTIGWTLSWIAFGLALGTLWYLVFPFVYSVTPAHTFDINYGIFTIDSQAKSFLEWIWLVVALVIWWKLMPVLVRWRAQLDRAMLAPSREQLERRVAVVSQSRTDTIDHSAAELRRIERDLHDGAQARLVALGMNLGMAEQVLASDPEEAARLLSEARLSTTSALGELRSVVRGIHPPVLSDRGLGGAVQALALDMAVPTSVLVDLAGRPALPVESAVYFAIAECLANIGKHSAATRAMVELTHDGASLHVTVQDNGRGGASLAAGTGLAGVTRRLEAFDGTMGIESPAGGPTVVTMEVPCALSSVKISPSSGTG